MQEQIRVSTKSVGTGRALVYLNGENIGLVHKRRGMWRSSLTLHQPYGSRKEAIAATVAAITG